MYSMRKRAASAVKTPKDWQRWNSTGFPPGCLTHSDVSEAPKCFALSHERRISFISISHFLWKGERGKWGDGVHLCVVGCFAFLGGASVPLCMMSMKFSSQQNLKTLSSSSFFFFSVVIFVFHLSSYSQNQLFKVEQKFDWECLWGLEVNTL